MPDMTRSVPQPALYDHAKNNCIRSAHDSEANHGAGREMLAHRASHYDFADINQADADATSGATFGATIKPVLSLPH
jgi:hypothetical protein